MTLERHRSNLIPDVDFGRDGQIFVTDRHGSFPLRSKHYDKPNSKDIEWDGKYDQDKRKSSKHKNDPWEYDRGDQYLGDVGSYHSFDPKREPRKYKQKGMTNYERAMREITGTVSSKSSNSLSRKLRRSKSNRYNVDAMENRYGSLPRSTDAYSTGRRFKRGGTPKMPPEMAYEFERSNSRYRSLDVNALRRAQKEMNNNDLDPYSYKMNGYASGPIFKDYIPRVKKITDDTLPFVLFITLGIILLLLGMVRLLFSYWHEYFCLLWTGLIVLVFGIVGACHRAQYLDPAKSIAYIVLSALSAVVTMLCAAFILPVLVPTIQDIVADVNTTFIPDRVTFSNWNQTLIPVSSMTTDVMVYLSMCVDMAALLVVCAGFSSLTVMLIALDYYWDASHDLTGECDHRGNPRFFNPLEQMSLAQATIFIGLLYINLQMPEAINYFSPVWGPFLLIIAGFSAICFGKRPDLTGLGFLSSVIQLVGMLGCGVATVLTTLGLVESVTTLMSEQKMLAYRESEVITSAVTASIFIVVMIINIVFAVGVMFRQVRLICCAECFDDYLDQPYHKGGDHDYDVRL